MTSTTRKASLIFLTLVLIVGLSGIVGCGSSGDDNDHDSDDNHIEAVHEHGDGPEYTSAYICPMHCEGSGSDQAGKCPVCGMAYFSQADHDKSHGL